MAIYQLFEEEKQTFTETFETQESIEVKTGKFAKSRLFSSCVSRISFAFLLIADLIWCVASVALLLLSLIGLGLTIGKASLFHRLFKKALLSVRRSLACGLGLFVGLVSPSFGIMVACTYFLMYDKSGIDEVVPGPLRSQFKDLFKG